MGKFTDVEKNYKQQTGFIMFKLSKKVVDSFSKFMQNHAQKWEFGWICTLKMTSSSFVKVSVKVTCFFQRILKDNVICVFIIMHGSW